ncbi:MAG: c-type cytochrome [Verrucomicrobia bacterium]|nr:c-type cytochrome [Verrucomicrobiota bacterium]
MKRLSPSTDSAPHPRVLAGLAWLSGLLLLSGPAQAQQAGGDLRSKIPELRTQAKDVLGPIPDKMPGSDRDTPELIALGKELYFDKRLSVNDTQSCNTCHVLDDQKGGVDNEPTSEGAFGKRGDRNSPTVLNAGFHFAQFWDGRASNLVEQAKGPILNPVEMAMPSEAEVVKKLSEIASYRRLFSRAFPNVAQPIAYDRLAEAIAAFERTLITRDRFDDFQKGSDQALNELELRGLELFLTAGCLTCHMGPVLGGTTYQKLGLIHPYNTTDKGRFTVTQNEDDLQKFKVPTLRNIALTGPYFHDGKQATLREAVQAMAYHQLDRRLTEPETDALVAFMNTLTDKARVPKR